MKFNFCLILSLLFLFSIPVFAVDTGIILDTIDIYDIVDITVYYGAGCPHCENTMNIFDKLGQEYTSKEVYNTEETRKELLDIFDKCSVPLNKQGVPTTKLNGETIIIGGMSEDYWVQLIEACNEGNCPVGYYTQDNIIEALTNGQGTCEPDGIDEKLTWGVLVGAALADSINPCTIAVIAMLLATILPQHGKKRVLLSGIAFSLTIFVCYMLMGVGIIQAINMSGVGFIFKVFITFLALLIAILEIRGYINYKPGLGSIEMPKCLRPYAKKVLGEATTIPLIIVAAIFCSLFLLPCSSGPYLVVLSLIATEITVQNLIYLTIYNIVFISPMIIITLVIGGGLTSPEKIQKAKEKYIRKIHLLAGILMLGVFILMILHILGYI